MGTLIQIPFIPKNIGSINTQIETNKSPLENAIINDSLANSTDWKYAPVTILIPIIINADEYILIELIAIDKTLSLGFTKILTISFGNRIQIIKNTTPIIKAVKNNCYFIKKNKTNYSINKA